MERPEPETPRQAAPRQAGETPRRPPSQRGLHWIEWLSQRPGAVRPIAVGLFVLAVGWMCLARWTSCATGAG